MYHELGVLVLIPGMCHGLSIVVKSEVLYAKEGEKKENKEDKKESSKIPCHQLQLITDFLCHPACQG